MKILALGGSIRGGKNRSEKSILSVAHAAHDLPSYLKHISTNISSVPLVSNSEILAGAALVGAKSEGAEISLFSLRRLFLGKSGNDALWQELGKEVSQASGILLSSPVYFGDRSSVIHDFLRSGFRQRSLVGKAVAALSVGAKRNGGQEATNLYLLEGALAAGAYVTGNGPPGSQFGGTAIGGDRSDVGLDSQGMQSAFETGRQLVRISRFLKPDRPEKSSSPLTITVLCVMDDSHQRLREVIKRHCESVTRKRPHIQFQIVNCLDFEIERCIACDICPIPELLTRPADYACIIRNENDGMKKIRETVLRTDGIIIGGVNFLPSAEIIDRYQTFMERTRFIRRNDFELSFLPTTSFLLEEAGATQDRLFPLRVLTSSLRQNAILCPPLTEIHHGGQSLRSAVPDLENFIDRVETIAYHRARLEKIEVSYQALGYRDKRLDATSHLR